jgi:hypothetical protein
VKKFNVTGMCVPEEHYMINIQEKLLQIMNLIHEGECKNI